MTLGVSILATMLIDFSGSRCQNALLLDNAIPIGRDWKRVKLAYDQAEKSRAPNFQAACWDGLLCHRATNRAAAASPSVQAMPIIQKPA